MSTKDDMIVSVVSRDVWTTVREISVATGIPPANLYHNLKMLEAYGILERRCAFCNDSAGRNNRVSFYRLREAGE